MKTKKLMHHKGLFFFAGAVLLLCNIGLFTTNGFLLVNSSWLVVFVLFGIFTIIFSLYFLDESSFGCYIGEEKCYRNTMIFFWSGIAIFVFYFSILI